MGKILSHFNHLNVLDFLLKLCYTIFRKGGRKMKRTRNSLKYRIFHFLNQIGIQDFLRAERTIRFTINEILLCIAILAVLFFVPALFH